MPATLTPEALELKRRGRRRLIGGATIALLMVVFLPMFFDSEPKRDKQEISIVVPAREGLPPLAAPVAMPPKGNSVAEPVRPAPPPAAPATAAVAAKAEAKPEIKPETKPASAPANTEIKPAPKPVALSAAKVADAPKREGFAVQVGAFSDPDNLKPLKAKLLAAKIPVYTEELKTATGTSTRLRAGPYKTRELAEKALLQVRKAGVVGGNVVPLP